MRIVRYQTRSGPRLGLLDGEEVAELADDIAHSRAEAVTVTAEYGSGPRLAVADLELLAPVVPSKIVAVGLNYRDHAEEQNQPLPERPLLFTKFPSAVTGPYADIEKLPETTKLDYEVELGVVIGPRARQVPRGRSREHVAGYVVVNDVSARDAQFEDGQWVRGKSFDTFAPMGPALVTTDEVSDPHRLTVRTWVNGELRQDSNTSNLIFDVDELIAYCSRYFTLEPGDVIATGTPGGVGVFLDPPRFLEPGDVVELEVGHVGRLINRVVEARTTA